MFISTGQDTRAVSKRASPSDFSPGFFFHLYTTHNALSLCSYNIDINKIVPLNPAKRNKIKYQMFQIPISGLRVGAPLVHNIWGSDRGTGCKYFLMSPLHLHTTTGANTNPQLSKNNCKMRTPKKPLLGREYLYEHYHY